MAPATSQQPWWELEPIPERRTELPETKAKMPTMQELYKAVKHGMTVRFHAEIPPYDAVPAQSSSACMLGSGPVKALASLKKKQEN